MKRIRDFFSFDKSLTSIVNSEGVKLSLISLSIPILMETALRNLMNTVNTYLLSFHSETAAAAVATAGQLQRLLMIFYSVISSGVTIIIAQNLGAGNRKWAEEAAALSITICTGVSLVIGVIGACFSRELMIWMNLEGVILEEATAYFSIVCGFNFIQTIITVFAAVTRSYGQTKINFIVALLMNAFNALFNWIVIFRPFEVPLHGIEGVAITRILAELSALLINVILVHRAKIRFAWKSLLKPKLDLIADIIRYGVPSGIGSVSYGISQTFSTRIMATTGVIALTTKSYVSSIVFFSYLISSAIGQANSVMIGQLVGKGDVDTAYRMSRQNVKISILCNMSFSMILFLFSDVLLGTFNISNPEIFELGRLIMLIDILVEIGRAMNNVEEGALRASGDVVFQAVIAMSSCWILSVGLSQVLGVWAGLGLAGCWLAFACDECTRGILYMIRWNSKKWQDKGITRKKGAAAQKSA